MAACEGVQLAREVTLSGFFIVHPRGFVGEVQRDVDEVFGVGSEKANGGSRDDGLPLHPAGIGEFDQ